MKKILLTEHDPFLISVYAGQLRKCGYSISIATDADIVISRIKSINPDLLILNSLDVLKLVRSESELNDLKIILLDNYAQQEEMQKASQLNISGYFTKTGHTAFELAGEIKKILS